MPFSLTRRAHKTFTRTAAGSSRTSRPTSTARFRPTFELLENRITPTAGMLDGTFGQGGLVTTDMGMQPTSNSAQAVAVQADGKIVVVGTTIQPGPRGTDFAVARRNADASPDTSFGANGNVALDFGSFNDFASCVAVQSDGKILVAGSSIRSDAAVNDFAVARLNGDGSLDTSFGSDGIVTISFAFQSGSSSVKGLTVQSDGRIVLAGVSQQVTGTDFAVARLNGADGSLDTSFDGDGKVTIDFGSSSEITTGVALQTDGKIVVVGTSQGNFAVARLSGDGSLDTSFDDDGKQTIDFGASSFDTAYGVAMQSDGKIVVAGDARTAHDRFAVFRLNSNGSLDTSFAGGGVTIDFGSFGAVAYSVTVQSDGKIVLAGHAAQSANGRDFAVARLNDNGTLDVNFDGDGKQTIDFGSSEESSTGVVVQSDGKIVVVGTSGQPLTGNDFAVARLNGVGSLDSSFDGNGRLLIDITRTSDDLTSGSQPAAVQADGKIVVAGSFLNYPTGSDFAVIRYQDDGTLDSAFGANGRVAIDFAGLSTDVALDYGSGDYGSSVAVQGDGKIVVAGRSQIEDFNSGADYFVFAVARLNGDGSLDVSFGSGGKQIIEFGTSYDNAVAVVVQSDGKIVLAGQSFQDGTGNDFALARLNSNGSLDSFFDFDGKKTIDFGSSNDQGTSLAVQANGQIVVAGLSYQGPGGEDFAVARLNITGGLDTSFDGDGKKTIDFGSSLDSGNGVAVQADGKIVVAGTSQGATSSDIAVARLNNNGSLDTSFDGDGRQTIDFGSSFDFGSGVVVQANGKIVVAGTSGGATSYDFAVAGLNGDGSLDTSFAGDGKQTIDFGPTASSDFGNGVVVQGDKIVVVGYSYQVTTGADFALARLNEDGDPDLFTQDGLQSALDGQPPTDPITGNPTVTILGNTQDQADAFVALFDPNAPGYTPLQAPAGASTPIDITITLAGGVQANEVVLTIPAGIRVQINGGTWHGGSPALTLSSGDLIITGATFVNDTDAPTILVTAGSLTLRDCVVQESTGFARTAIEVSGGTVNLGSAANPGNNILNVNGTGKLILNHGASAISAIGNTFEKGGVVLSSPYRIEDLIVDALDAGGGGLVTFVDNNVYVTGAKNSIQGGIDAVAPGGTVNVESGVKARFTVGDKPVTVSFQNGPSLGLQADTLHLGQIMLVVTGTANDDSIRILGADDDPNSLKVKFTDRDMGNFRIRGAASSSLSRIVVYGSAGNDDIKLNDEVTIPGWLYGGDGNDRLKGGNGPNVLVGGTGDDFLVGGDNRDLLIGGTGADRLVGNGGDDILLGGITSYDAADVALATLMAEWTSTHDFATRVANIANQANRPDFGNRLNDNYFLVDAGAGQTVFNDSSKDTLQGDAGKDWFFTGAADKLTDLTTADLDFIFT
jgi:uncharacterized delta-60 repeat protein